MIDKNLKALLELNNISVAKLSRDTNIPRTNIHQWLTGSSPNINQAYVVANYFNTTLEKLCFDNVQSINSPSVVKELYIDSGSYKIQIIKLNEPVDKENA